MLSASADNTYRDLDNSVYHEKPNSIIVLVYIESLKIIKYKTATKNTAPQNVFNIVLTESFIWVLKLSFP